MLEFGMIIFRNSISRALIATALVAMSFSSLAIIPPATQLTQYRYDSQGNLKTSTDPLSHVTANDYDPQDNLTAVTDQRGLTTSYGYSGFNELKRLTSPDTGTTD